MSTTQDSTAGAVSVAQHTPGPWTIYAHRTIQGAGKNVASIAHPGREPANSAEMDANARLIAAAPELLAVLRRVQPHLEGQRDRYAKLGLDAAFEDYENLIQAARAAIAKAEGQS